MIRTANVNELPEQREGFRVLVMRKWPRGVPRDRIDLWAKELGPSPELLKEFKKGKISLAVFHARYRGEVSEPGRQELVADLQRRSMNGIQVVLTCDGDSDDASARGIMKEILETT